MRFLYVAPRYHTNQVPIMKGLIENGHEVLFLSQYVGGIEDYEYVTPKVIGYSWLSVLLLSAVGMFKGWTSHQLSHKKMRMGIPPIFKIYRSIKRFYPDIVILRERSLYTIFTYQICRFLKVKSILYDQNPLWNDRIKNDLPHRIIRKLTPAKRMTPVLGVPGAGKVKEPEASFVPFVMEPMLSPEQKQFSEDGRLRIFCIGKYENMKNHFMLLDAMFDVMERSNIKIQLVIAGECTTDRHLDYFTRLEKIRNEHEMCNRIVLLQNLTRTQIFDEFVKSDFFVLPSTGDIASIAQLEAMAFSLPVICSDSNGADCYIKEGINGYIFKDNNVESLKEAINKLISDSEQLKNMGAMSYKIIEEMCSFETYYDSIRQMIKHS